MTPLSALFNFFRGPKIPLCSVERIFFGIGNPGSRYADTRHNVGCMVIDQMSRLLTGVSKYRGAAWSMEVGCREGKTIALVKPKTYVNLSGGAFADAVNKVKCPLASCCVIVDDYHLPLGTIRLRPKGADGGHNGLKSIIERVGEGFPRLRIGIGPLPEGAASVDFVLGLFSAEEEAALDDVLKKAEEALMLFTSSGIDAAMNRYNK